ncbi:aminotransferase class I/II-fold pyridoxal phosphate-dependent enzyme [Mycobacterium marinum]|uniref:8-amino-7-oxononanoate synthase n=1 Tax=Mycobacterium marinum (strain ATCC BAA-535 / M) TaxID=216594 RepID=B2HIH9_MYCMM|nr:aminotransferase class I/II-fold pyridoxal phosphate-dependent enzyme [Mycobacterium marinum]ACC40173.1 8-amino-7-oxononanoate synthase BioF2_2 [Mycobacterium marinum M]EPQ75475.1 2-amino-3-ketobutyrate coenzyme A ligase [Mycobacterium marinum MB2]MDC8972842.1 aminotransferase class I/II-fold pyridoxal phosphate-dependent enzyme [Mycobacterium marinum]MDC9003443.1 aminotransferase class I/II-fold pyridoxal phosphate-dependent enzyme [Mycobacterium marinum]RFZ68844.1 8-amino-7-oxononanoate s
MDLFAKLVADQDPLFQLSRAIHGIATFPKLGGAAGTRMTWRDDEYIIWNLNNYLGLADHPEVRAADAEFAGRYGLATPMGSRMMSGETDDLELLESELADYAQKPAALVLNYGYQGMISLIDSLTTEVDWIVSDAENHACIIDGIRLHRKRGERTRMFAHNDIDQLETHLAEINRVRGPDSGVLVVTEGVFGMSGDQGALREIAALKQQYDFRLLVDDAHGFGVLGPNGGGTGEQQGVQDDIDLYFGTFTKAAAGAGAFVASQADVIWKLRYTMRSQIFSRGLPWPIVAGNRVRLGLLRRSDDLRRRAHAVAGKLQASLTEEGLNIGKANSLITPVYLPMDPLSALAFLTELRHKHGIFCSAVTYPVVPPGIVQLRLISTAGHDIADVEPTVKAIAAVYKELTGNQTIPQLDNAPT